MTATDIILLVLMLFFASLGGIALVTAGIFALAGWKFKETKKKQRLLIYIAGPLSGQDGKIGALSNVEKAVEIAEQIYEKGQGAYIPHLTVLQHKILQRIRPGYVPTYERWLEHDFRIIERCDALFFIAPSPGANKEKAFAESIGLPVYTKVEDIPKGEGTCLSGQIEGR